ncbi:hypothetical protein E8E14_013479 [Neopestalotiopsis sp. 37M]|nr:hypothetical protein E8E14_013479 [Neopestalotiopsis sp. 37M]
MSASLTPGVPETSLGSSAEQHNVADPKAYLDDPRFSQSFTIPPGPDRSEPLTVAYSDFGYRNPDHPESEHVLLFCGPLMCTRFLHADKDKLAKRYNVRIINLDRPGFGGTTRRDSQFRLETWLEIVPALLSHLNISHISLACHSAGTLYALHALLHLRPLLHPERPYVAFCTPWVLPRHSGVQTMKLTDALVPATLMRQFDGVARFVNTAVGPVIGFSGNLLRSVSSSSAADPSPKLPPVPGADAEMVEFEDALMPHVVDRAYAESTQGLSQEIPLLFKKCGAGQLLDADAWSPWGDIDKYVPMLAAAEATRAGSTSVPTGRDGAKLKVEVFFSEQDHMIGTSSGPEWFRQCWSEENRGDNILFESHIVDRAEHDNILGLRFGVAERIFQRISGMNNS